ncbi:outer membrane protein assembly factor BamB family protein [Lacimicrobium alkaliphilum]|uniref:Pyrrolo-quinoline quinone repeat domain-containing protein n=1 Tax=Lacimicrobium alkaliphilum TaxID=1526571 RepID=A0ABQ1R9K5_9ALTE|nr:PQQ-binding-like beta-propeller repeat protein [Lacimicrobium alkaliphilum]GGD61410.1 hypothetical protein GCM10011357_15940 [Lacimicrobium alkaliphilum]
MKLLYAVVAYLLCLLATPLNAAEPLWQHQLDGPISGQPLVTERGIYVTANKSLYQFSAGGELLERLDFSSRLYATPVAYQDGLLIHAEDGLYALDHEGNQRWHHYSVDGPLKTEGQGWGWGEGLFTDPWAWYRSSVTIKGEQAYYGTASGTYAVLLKDGSRLWHSDTGVTHTTPLLVADRLIVGSWNNHLYGLDPQTGQRIWHFEGGTPKGAMADWNGWLGFNLDPVGDNKSVYVGNRGSYFYRISAATGDLIWAVKQATSWIGSPAIIHQDKIYYGLSDGLGLMVQNKSSGNIQQFIPMPHLIFAAPVAAKEHIYFATLSGEVFELNSTTSEYRRVYQTGTSTKNYAVHVKEDGGPIYQKRPVDMTSHLGARWQIQQIWQGLDSILSLSYQHGTLYLGTATGKLISLQVGQVD